MAVPQKYQEQIAAVREQASRVAAQAQQTASEAVKRAREMSKKANAAMREPFIDAPVSAGLALGGGAAVAAVDSVMPDPLFTWGQAEDGTGGVSITVGDAIGPVLFFLSATEQSMAMNRAASGAMGATGYKLGKGLLAGAFK